MEGTIVYAHEQTAGRGQRGNNWESRPGQNLTISLSLTPGFMSPSQQFLLSMVTSLAVADVLAAAGIKEVKIKWPNDILVKGQKLCGILIENQVKGTQLSSSIVGIGLNINQRNFSYHRATSMRLQSDHIHEIAEVMGSLCYYFEAWYLRLKRNEVAHIRNAYLERLYRRNERSIFEAGKLFIGVIKEVDESGRLIVDCGDQVRAFGFKEIALIH